MIGQVLLHFFERMSLPRSRDVLLGRIGPPVAVMEVNHHLHAEGFGTLGLDQHIFLVAPIVMLRRVYPYTKTDGIHTVFLHQGCTFTLLPFIIIESMSFRLHFSGPTDVGTFVEINHFFCFAFQFFFLGRRGRTSGHCPHGRGKNPYTQNVFHTSIQFKMLGKDKVFRRGFHGFRG